MLNLWGDYHYDLVDLLSVFCCVFIYFFWNFLACYKYSIHFMTPLNDSVSLHSAFYPCLFYYSIYSTYSFSDFDGILMVCDL